MSNGQSKWSIFSFAKHFDAYPKIVGFEDFQIKTISGAVVSLAAYGLMIFLFVCEVYDYITPRITEDISVDFSRQHSISIYFTIDFPSIPCDSLSLDVEDDSGYHQTNVKVNVSRIPLLRTSMGDDRLIDVEIVKNEIPKAEECGSCYGAVTPFRNCCNTCIEIIENYEYFRWQPRVEDFEQCRNEKLTNKDRRKKEGGCSFTGSLQVNRVAGNFHFTPGQSLDIENMHVHAMASLKGNEIDLSHVIRQLSFAAPVKEQPRGPLDSYEFKTEAKLQSISYYLKVVPTIYQKLDGSSFPAHQFSVTQKHKDFDSVDSKGDLPGVIFHYEFSPMIVKYTEERRSFGHFLTGLCAIVGGVYTVASFIDQLIFRCGDALRRKIELGKMG